MQAQKLCLFILLHLILVANFKPNEANETTLAHGTDIISAADESETSPTNTETTVETEAFDDDKIYATGESITGQPSAETTVEAPAADEISAAAESETNQSTTETTVEAPAADEISAAEESESSQFFAETTVETVTDETDELITFPKVRALGNEIERNKTETIQEENPSNWYDICKPVSYKDLECFICENGDCHKDKCDGFKRPVCVTYQMKSNFRKSHCAEDSKSLKSAGGENVTSCRKCFTKLCNDPKPRKGFFFPSGPHNINC